MNKAGIKAEVLYLDDDRKMNNTGNIIATTRPPPIVYGEVKFIHVIYLAMSQFLNLPALPL